MTTYDQSNGKLDSISDSSNTVPTSFEAPKWLTAEVFEKLLNEIEPNHRQIKNLEIKPALAAGENFCTQIVRIKIDTELKDGTPKLLSFMMKLPSQDAFVADLSAQHNIVEVEYEMYRDVVPELEKLYRDAGEEVIFSAKFYDIDTPSKLDAILLEDLGPRGYKNANRLEGLDMEHTKAVLKRLAQWHAASAVRVETKGPYADLFQKGMFHETQREAMSKFNVRMGIQFLEALHTITSLEEYFDSVTNTFMILFEELFKTAKTDPSEFNVLNHGDSWCNNVMFKYDKEGKLIDTILIDYQLASYGTPAKDLHYFLMSSTSYDIKIKHFDYFIKFYHENLVRNLKLLNYPKTLPTLKEIHKTMLKYGIWGLMVVFVIMAIALLESDEVTGGQFMGTSEAADRFRTAMFANPRYQKHLEIIIPWMSNRGVFVE